MDLAKVLFCLFIYFVENEEIMLVQKEFVIFLFLLFKIFVNMVEIFTIILQSPKLLCQLHLGFY